MNPILDELTASAEADMPLTFSVRHDRPMRAYQLFSRCPSCFRSFRPVVLTEYVVDSAVPGQIGHLTKRIRELLSGHTPDCVSGTCTGAGA